MAKCRLRQWSWWVSVILSLPELWESNGGFFDALREAYGQVLAIIYSIIQLLPICCMSFRKMAWTNYKLSESWLRRLFPSFLCWWFIITRTEKEIDRSLHGTWDLEKRVWSMGLKNTVSLKNFMCGTKKEKFNGQFKRIRETDERASYHYCCNISSDGCGRNFGSGRVLSGVVRMTFTYVNAGWTIRRQ